MATLISVPIGATSKAPQYGTERTLRASAVLTLAPAVVSTNDLDAQGADAVEIVSDFTVGASTGCRMQIFTSDDLVTFVEQSVFDPSTGDLTQLEVIVAGTSVRSFRFVPGRRYVRVSAYATGAFAGTLLAITARGIHDARSFA